MMLKCVYVCANNALLLLGSEERYLNFSCYVCSKKRAVKQQKNKIINKKMSSLKTGRLDDFAFIFSSNSNSKYSH